MTAFPAGLLDFQADLHVGGAWTSATSLVYQRDGNAPPASVERGRADESSQANPGKATFEVNNRGGQFSPKNPLGPWYGQLGRNTPARLSIPAQANCLRLEEGPVPRAFVNDTGGGSPLGISGSIEMRIQLRLTDWQGCILACKWDGGGCWYWKLQDDGTLAFGWFDSGVTFHSVTSSVPLPFSRGTMALRVTMDASTGNVTFSTSASIGGTYATLGAAQSGTGGAATSIAVNHSSPLLVGYSFALAGTFPVQLYGQVDEYRLLNGIGGSVAADGAFSAQSAGTTTWTDSAGNAWQLASGAEISGRDYRFHGEVAALPPKWDVTGADQSVQVTASGPLRRLGQGQAPVQSPLKRALASRTGTLAPVAYWTWEDGAGSQALGSAVGGPLMQFDGSPQLAQDSSFAASAPLPQLNGARFLGPVPAYAGSGNIVVRFPMKLGTAPASTLPLVRLVTSGTAGTVDLSVTSAGFLNVTSSGAGTFVTNLVSPTGGGSWSGQQWWMSMELRPSGGNVQMTLVMLSPAQGQAFVSPTTTFAGSVGNISQVRVNPSGGFADTVLGHFSVQADWETMFNFQDPLDAWAGETAAARFARLCAENGLACRIIGSPGQSAAMGQQGISALMSLLQECEDADRGLIHEPRQVLALGYRTLASMCNQAPRVTVDYSLSQLGGTTGSDATGLDPTYDDQRVRNAETITRGNSGGSGSQGAVYQYELDDGSPLSVGVAGDYSDSQTVNVQSDSQVPNVAGWLVHVGTVDEARYPSVPFNLRRNAIWTASLYYPLLGVDIGDYALISNLPQVITYDPARQLAFGLKEWLGGFHHTMEINAVPESPYEVIVLDDPVYGRVDTAGSQLAASASSGATTLTVKTTDGPLWTTADVPFDINVGGERCTVTAVAASPQPGMGTRVGAYLDGTSLDGVSGWTAAAAKWASLTGVPLACSRWYAGTTYSVGATLTQMAGAGIRILIDFAPPYAPVSSSDRTSIVSMLTTLQGLGGDVLVSLWHEPNLGGLSASQYVSMVQYYGPSIQALGIPVYAVFSGSDCIESNGYYPGDGFVDGIAADCYATSTDNLLNCAGMADNHALPVGLWEYNAAFDLGISPSPVSGVTQAQGAGFLGYLLAFFGRRVAMGLPCGDICLFSAAGGGSTGTGNFLGTALGDPAGFESSTAHWVNTGNCSIARTTAQAHSGAASLSLTSSAAGNMSARPENIATSTTYALPVTPGQQVAVSAWFRAATLVRNCHVDVTWYDSGHVNLSTTSGTAVADSASAWTFASSAPTAPASSAFAIAHVQVDSAGAGGEVHYVDDVQISLLPSSTDHTAPVQFPWDWRIASVSAIQAALDSTSWPWQQMTVTRSVNGVTKSHSAGEDVRLWYPPVLALT